MGADYSSLQVFVNYLLKQLVQNQGKPFQWQGLWDFDHSCHVELIRLDRMGPRFLLAGTLSNYTVLYLGRKLREAGCAVCQQKPSALRNLEW